MPSRKSPSQRALTARLTRALAAGGTHSGRVANARPSPPSQADRRRQTGAASLLIADETTLLPSRSLLRFRGGAITAVDNGVDATEVTVTAAQSTVGPGLPTVAGRSKGDLHYNETDGQQYELIGEPGVIASDTFARADAGPSTTALGTTETGSQIWLLQDFSAPTPVKTASIVSGQARLDTSANASIYGEGDFDVSVTIHRDPTSGDDGTPGVFAHAPIDSQGVNPDRLFTSGPSGYFVEARLNFTEWYKPGPTGPVYIGTFGGGHAGGETCTLRYTRAGTTLHGYLNGVLVMTDTDTYPVNSGYSGFGNLFGGDTANRFSNFAATLAGTQHWTISNPPVPDPESIRDTIAAALVAGSGVSIAVDDAANTITISSTGGGGGSGPSASTGALLVRSTDLSPVARNGVGGVYTTRQLIPWSAAEWDTGGFWSSTAATRLTIATTGQYRIRASAMLYGWAAGDFGNLSIMVNGVERGAEIRHTGKADWFTLAVEREISLVAGDYVEIGIDQRSANTLTLVGAVEGTNASIEMLAGGSATDPATLADLTLMGALF